MQINITFGIIVLNGEPFTRYCINALYPHAYEIIIAEGACEGARVIATPEGHSRDGTLEILREFKKQEDPENKITIITAEDEGHPDGFWPGEKHEQSRAYAKRATGNYLWQVDIDEFYLDEDINRIRRILSKDPGITQLGFKQIQFFYGFDYYVDTWYNRRHLKEIIRVFSWGKGYSYLKHRPPTVLNKNGEDLKNINYLNSEFTKSNGIYLYHYSYVLPKQVENKINYYKNVNWSNLNSITGWYNDNFYSQKHPYRLFVMPEFPGWVRKFKGKHPGRIYELINELNEKGETFIDDSRLKKLTSSFPYNAGILFLICYEPVDRYIKIYYSKFKRLIPQKIKNWLKRLMSIK